MDTPDLRHIQIADLMAELCVRIVSREREGDAAMRGIMALQERMAQFASTARREWLAEELRNFADRVERRVPERVG